jgi:hypothetical protein
VVGDGERALPGVLAGLQNGSPCIQALMPTTTWST